MEKMKNKKVTTIKKSIISLRAKHKEKTISKKQNSHNKLENHRDEASQFKPENHVINAKNKSYEKRRTSSN